MDLATIINTAIIVSGTLICIAGMGVATWSLMGGGLDKSVNNAENNTPQ